MRHGMRRLAAVAVAATWLVGTAAGLAQRAENPPSANIRPGQAGRDGSLISVNFKGGTLAEFVAALRGASESTVNVALTGDVASLPIEPVLLRDVSVDSALRAVLASHMGVGEDSEGRQTIVQIDNFDAHGAVGSPVISVSRKGIGQVGPVARSQPRQNPDRQFVEVYTIQPLVQGEAGKARAQVVLTAVQTALGLGQERNEPEPQIKYHEDSGLLLVRGTGQQVSLVGQVVRRMISDQEQRAAIESQRRMHSINRRAELQKAEIRMRLADSQYGRLADELKRAQAEVAKGGQKQDLAVEFMDALERARAERDMARIDVERLGQEAELPDLAPAPAADDSSELLIQTLKTRIEQLEKELAALKGKPAAKPGSREE